VLPINWYTLELQLAVLWLFVASALAGLQGFPRRRISWFSTIGSWGNHFASLVLRWGERCIVVGLVFTGGAFAILIGKFIFDDYPYSGDEWSYFLQAEIFSQGHLHVNSPLHPRFLDVWGMVNDGKFYAWTPPGWPLLLVSGILLQVPWLVNPLVAALTRLSVYYLGRLVYNASVALLAVLFMLLSLFFLLHSASYFAHSSSLLFITLCVFFGARGIERKTKREFLWAGLCGSMSFLNAIVFIRYVSGDFQPWNLTRNPPDFQGKLLYAQDLERLNHLLIGHCPRQKFFAYEYDDAKLPILRPLMVDEAVRPDG
jgi:hypothetical protein